MTFSETSPDMLNGELRTIDVELTNAGPVEMRNLHIAVSHPSCIALAAPSDGEFRRLYDDKYRDPPAYGGEFIVCSHTACVIELITITKILYVSL